MCLQDSGYFYGKMAADLLYEEIWLFLWRNAVGKKEATTAFDRFCAEKVLYFIKK